MPLKPTEQRTTRNSNKPQSPPVPSAPSPALSSESSGSTASPGGSTTCSPSPAPSVPEHGNSASTHTRRTSIIDLDVAGMDALGKTMGDISAVISSAKISRPAISELEELRELEDLVEKYQKAADWVKDQDHVEFTTVKAVPLSKTTIPLLESIGTEFPKKSLKLVNDDMMTQEWLTSKNVLSEEDLVKLEQWDKTVLTRTLEWLDYTVSDKVEASARMTIDQWVLELGRFYEELGIIIQVFPEAVISSPDAPAVISHGKVRIRLTGLTDYLVWKVSVSERDNLEANMMGKNTFQRYQDIQKVTVEVNHLASGARLLFIEAKNVHEKLLSHLAQAVAQIIAAYEIYIDFKIHLA